MSSLQGLFLIGKMVGYRQVAGVSKKTNQPYTIDYLGISQQRPDGFGGTRDDITQVQIPRAALEAGIIQTINEHKDKEVLVSCFVTAFSSAGGAGYQFMLSTDSDSIQLLSKTALKVA